MCLISLREKPFVAKSPIKCYKLLSFNRDNFVTPITNSPLSSLFKYHHLIDICNNEYEYLFKAKELTIEAKGEEDIVKTTSRYTEVNGGYIHAYTTPYCVGPLTFPSVLVQAVIPKGVEFYIDESLFEICAKEMILLVDINSDYFPIYSHLLDVYDDPYKDMCINKIIDTNSAFDQIIDVNESEKEMLILASQCNLNSYLGKKGITHTFGVEYNSKFQLAALRNFDFFYYHYAPSRFVTLNKKLTDEEFERYLKLKNK